MSFFAMRFSFMQLIDFAALDRENGTSETSDY